MPLTFPFGIGGTRTGNYATTRGQQIDDVGSVEAHGLTALQMDAVGAVAKHVADGPVLGTRGEGGQGRMAAVQTAEAVGVVQPSGIDPGVARQVQMRRMGTVGLGGGGVGGSGGSVGIPRQVDRPDDDAAAPVARPGQGELHVDGFCIGSCRCCCRCCRCRWAHCSLCFRPATLPVRAYLVVVFGTSCAGLEMSKHYFLNSSH